MVTDHSEARQIRSLAVSSRLRESLTRRTYSAADDRTNLDGGSDRFAVSLSLVVQTAAVNPHLPIAWPHWPPGVLPKARAALQKLTRRLLAWYINPIVAQQNTHNFHLLQALQEAERVNQQLSDRLAALERDHRDLSARVQSLAEAGRAPVIATSWDGDRASDRRSSRPVGPNTSR